MMSIYSEISEKYRACEWKCVPGKEETRCSRGMQTTEGARVMQRFFYVARTGYTRSYTQTEKKGRVRDRGRERET